MAYASVEARLESRSFSCDHLQIHKLSGREAISQLFTFDLEVVSAVSDEPVALEMSGAEVTIVFSRGGEDQRRIHGIIAEVDEMFETEGEHRSYRLRVVPRAFRLTLVELQDIYIDQSVPEIVRQKLELLGFTSDDIELRLLASYPALELVVQYKETDLALVSRLTEHVGISFFFEHGARRDKMVFTDGHGFPKVPGREEILFRPRGEPGNAFCFCICIEGKTKLIPKSYVLEDDNGAAPSADRAPSHESPMGYSGGVVEYGAHFKTPEAGAALAKIRAEEREAGRFVLSGKSGVCELSAGFRFALREHPRFNGTELLVTAIEHALIQPTLIHAGREGAHYENTFRAINAGFLYRPPRVTPKPRIHGVITGVIEQEPDVLNGQYARIDAQGRYRVKLPFGTALPGLREASRPVRVVMNPHAGGEGEVHSPLKPGAAVLVAFIDSDPDRPLIIGAGRDAVALESALNNAVNPGRGVGVPMRET